MQCPRCQTENPAHQKLCLKCAAPLARACVNCGTQLPSAAKFCPECAHPAAISAATERRYASPASYTPKHLAERILTSRSALEGERKQVTVLFQMRIGINTGSVVVARIGDNLRMDYTAQGDTTNLAARLQQVAPPGAIWVGESAYRVARGAFEWRPIGPLTVKGREAPVGAY